MNYSESRKGFASDNNSGVHPEILKEIELCNKGHAIGYGADKFTEKALGLFREKLGPETETYFVLTGTAANVLGITAVTRSWYSVITANTAHLEQDECGAPEKFTGCKVLTVDTSNGKISPGMIEKHMHGFDFEHHSQPKIISITQSTEMGTVYTVGEITELAGYAHSRGMLLHMDGARLANAAVSLNLSFREITTDAGVDLLSFGGTKNGMMAGEAVCFLRKGLSRDFKYIRKQGMHLASKMRYISAQYIAYFRDDLWKSLASHANRMAQVFAQKLSVISNLRITQEVQSNGVFVIIPPEVAEKLQKKYFFYPWDEAISEYRLMASWDTTEKEIDDFVSLLGKEMIDYQ